MRGAMAAMVAGVVVAGLARGEGPPKAERPRFPPGVPEMVPDAGWRPRAGDRAEMLATTAGDPTDGRNGLAKGTPVLVVAYAPPERTRRVYSSGLEFGRAMREAVLNPARAPMTVRALGGPAKGQAFEVMDNEVGVMVPNPRPWLPFAEGDTMAIWDASAPAAVDVASYYAIRRDPGRAAGLISRHKAFRLRPGTRVEVVQPGIDETRPDGLEITRVRVLKGQLHAGKVGLVYRGNLARP